MISFFDFCEIILDLHYYLILFDCLSEFLVSTGHKAICVSPLFDLSIYFMFQLT